MTRSLVLVAAVLLGANPMPVSAQASADRIFVNGNIWTADDARPRAEALAIRGETVLAVSSSAEIRALAGPHTAVVDLKGRLVVPGFMDSHLHFPGASLDNVELDGLESLAAFQGRLAEFAKAHPTLPWITGGGWGYAAFPGQIAHKKHVDAVVSDRPAYLVARDGHMGIANTKAMQLAGITRETKDPPNGHIVRDAFGEPTGELQEAAQRLVWALIPEPSADERYASFLKHMETAAAQGLTAVQNASWGPEDQPLYLRALAAGALKLRFHFAASILPGEGGAPKNHHLEKPLQAADLAHYKELRETFRGPLITFGSIKGVLDGTVDARTAAMFEPYVGGGTGIPFWEQDDLNQTVALYDKEGFQVLLHAIGDKAIHMALDAFEHAARVNGTTGRRHRVEHAEVPLLSDLPRFRQLGVIASTQALFANPDQTVLDNFAVLLGPERASRADSFKLYDDAGAVQAFGSDWGVFDYAPLKGLYAAVTRMTPAGTPPGGWYPEGRISVEAALRHYTRDGAYASFDEDVRGTLAPGQLADLVVLSEDILSAPPAKILETKVLLTVMGGRDTWRAASF
ncbi:MAG: amidohydrolase [Vicinamibacteria bacterium]|nr:amidohydrolase [Vicinamibacteria bacterium]